MDSTEVTQFAALYAYTLNVKVSKKFQRYFAIASCLGRFTGVGKIICNKKFGLLRLFTSSMVYIFDI